MPKPIKICHISTVHPAFDDRIYYKECKFLTKASYEVNLVVKHNKDEILNDINIIALKNYQSRIKRIVFGSFIALKKALSTKSKIYHFHDPELMFIGIILRLLMKKVIYDVHEDIPKQLLYKPWIKSKFIKLILSKTIYLYEQFACLFFNRIITVTDDIYKKYNSKKTIILRNLPLLSITTENTTLKDLRKNNDKTIFIYVGGLSKIRGIKEITLAFKQIKNKAELWLLGEWEDNNYKNECLNSENQNYIKYFGFKKMQEVYSYISIADVGLAMLYPIKNYLTSLPVKAFEYMRFEKPIIMSNFKYWEKEFKDTALFANPYNINEIATKAKLLINNISTRKQLGKNGFRKIKNKLSWEVEQKKLIELYQELSKLRLPT